MASVSTLLARGAAVVFALAAVGVSLAAVLALLGFVHEALDLLNHAQPAIFPATLLALLLCPFLMPGRWRAAMLAVTATGFLATGVVVVPEFITSLAPRDPVPGDGRPVYRLMTFNLFGLNYDTEAMVGEIVSADPDIIALQEFFPPQRRRLAPYLAANYPFARVCDGGRRANIAIYSRLPFASPTDACQSAADNSRITARFAGTDGTAFSVVTTHMDWPVPFDLQRPELAALAEALVPETGPLILVGDFNSTPWSYALRGLTQRAGLVRHTRSLATFPTRWYIRGWRQTPPFLPLDHVMTKGPVAVHSLRTGKSAGSDHLPVVVEFSVSSPPDQLRVSP